MKTRTIAAIAMAVYIGAIVLSNYFIVHGLPFGWSTPTPYGTYTVPVGFGLLAPAGVYMAAVTWPRGTSVQRSGGRILGAVAIVVAALVSWWVSPPAIAIASGGTYLISESIDFAVYTPLATPLVRPRGYRFGRRGCGGGQPHLPQVGRDSL